MHVVVFEVWPKAEHKGEYLDIAAALRSDLEQVDGFISVERFASLTEEGKLLSLSFWRDEESIARWRAQQAHRAAQGRGRHELFRDYRLRVAEVARDYGPKNRDEAPQP